MSQGSDMRGVHTAGKDSGSAAYAILEWLKRHGYVEPTAEVKPNESVEELLSRLSSNPHDKSITESGYKNPGVMTVVHEAVHGAHANTAFNSPYHLDPAPAISSGYPGIPGRSQQDFHNIPHEDLQYMLQGDQYMVQVWTFEKPAQILEQDLDGGKLPNWACAAFEMPITVADVISHKGEVYPKEIWDTNVPSLKQMAQQKRLLGRNDHPSNPGEVLGETSLMFSDIGWAPTRRQDGGWELMGRGYIYNTSAGRDLYTILQSGVPVDVSSRGWGRVERGNWRGNPATIVQNFVCRAFDAVIGGASPGAGFSKAVLHQSNDDNDDDDDKYDEILPEIKKNEKVKKDEGVKFPGISIVRLRIVPLLRAVSR